MSKWKTYKLGEICTDIAMGPFGSNLKVDNFIDEGVPVIKGTNLHEGGFAKANFSYVSEEKANSLKRCLAYPDDLVFTHRGTLGQVGIIPQNLFPKYLVSQSQMRLTVDKNYLLPKYLYYFFKSNLGQKELLKNSSQVGVPAIANPTKSLKQVEITVPDLPTQTQIAQILTSLDDKIELNLQMNQTLEAMAQALFKEWFINFNFPNFDGVLENGLPKGWSYKTIKDLGKVVTGNTPSSKNPEYFGEVTPFVTPTDFKNFGKLIIGANRYLSVEGSNAMKTRLLPKHSIIVTCIGSDMGKVAINSIECVTNQQINSIIPNDKSYVDYLYYDLVYKYDYLRNIATGGSTMPIINKSRFEEIEILIPNSNVLENFQVLMDSFNSKIEENIRQTQSLTQTRDTLLPKLMGGKLEIV
ncbi:MAG: restriction endonuclease subunit S [Saprospiraceae bacterium]|nr:restriction endonuclease subunit S [Saprospiraceae bacterium]